jgi:CheY-like chemotaxis protein
VEAIAALKSTRYDLVLMDVQMPEMGGIEATKKIREPNSGVHNHAIPVIALTARALKGDRETFLAAGMDDYLSKPIDSKALKDVLNKYLGNIPACDTNQSYGPGL